MWTRPVWPSRRMVLDHAERGQRIDEAGGAVARASRRRAAPARRRPSRCGTGAYIAPPRMATVLPISALAAPAPASTTTPAPSLPTGSDWLDAARPCAAELRRDLRGDARLVAGAGSRRGGEVGRAEQQAEVGRVDRRGLDADQDLVVVRRRDRNPRQRQLELPAPSPASAAAARSLGCCRSCRLSRRPRTLASPSQTAGVIPEARASELSGICSALLFEVGPGQALRAFRDDTEKEARAIPHRPWHQIE